MITMRIAAIFSKARICALSLALVPAIAAGLLCSACRSENEKRGAALYGTLCSSCHGPEGVGQSPARPCGAIDPQQEGFIAPALNGRGHCADHPRREVFAIVKEGSIIPGSPMKGFREKLSDSDIAAIQTYLESLWDRPTRKLYEQRETELRRLVQSASP